MEASDFDQFLLSVGDVPFLGFAVPKYDVTGLEKAFRVEGFGVRFGVLEVACDDDGAADAELATDVVGRNIVSVVVNDPGIF